MGEYAIRKSDGERVKVGTCEDMYYLRYEDWDKIRYDVSSPAGFRFRLPFPDEDTVPIGEHQDHRRGVRLCRKISGASPSQDHWEDFADKGTLDDPGGIQLRHEASGLLLNVPCYHGLILPNVGPNMKAFWNGKGHSFELTQVKAVKNDAGEIEIKPVVTCRHCRKAWRYEWAEIMDYVFDVELRKRLEVYAMVAA